MRETLAWPLQRAADVRADSVAALEDDRRFNWAELASRVGSLGSGLDDLEVEIGGTVAVLAENSVEHLECWLGIAAHGRVINDLNHRLTVPELAHMIHHSKAQVLISEARFLDQARALLERCEGVRDLVLFDTSNSDSDSIAYADLLRGEIPFPEVDSRTLAALSYTGGTTGVPKGVMLSHENLLANAKHVILTGRHESADRYLHAAPMFHVADTSQTFAMTWVGGTHVVVRRFEPGEVARVIELTGVSVTLLVPTMINMLVDHLETESRELPTLSKLFYGASPISAPLQRRAAEVLGCALGQLYGMTEASPLVTYLSFDDHRRGFAGEEPYATRLRSVGTPVPGVQAEVRDGVGVRVRSGEVGEIWIRGANVMPGYLNNAEATSAALVDGWYRTGDGGYLDEHSYLFVVDRLKDMIVTGGENVYCAEVESVIAAHPAVGEVAVIGVPSEQWGETVHAIVVLRANQRVGEEDLLAHCREALAGYKMPRSIELRTDPLPKSGAGKVLKTELREPHWQGADSRVA